MTKSSPNDTCYCLSARKFYLAISRIYDQSIAGISTNQFNALAVIAKHPNKNITQLSEFMGIDRSTFTRNVSLLLRTGLVRTFDSLDRRVKMHELTHKGLNALQDALPLWNSAQKIMMNKVPEIEDLLLKLNEITDRLS